MTSQTGRYTVEGPRLCPPHRVPGFRVLLKSRGSDCTGSVLSNGETRNSKNRHFSSVSIFTNLID